jgi:hypothetical protein
MEDKTKYYKEVIKSRMYKTATGIWGIRNIDDFDPVIKLLIESLASEIYRLSGEMESLEARLLERIAGILTPDILTSVRPAHMILHALPMEDYADVNGRSCFSVQRKTIEDIHFFPAADFRLIRGEVQSIICAGKIFVMDGMKSKEIYARSGKRSGKFTDRLWIGLSISPSITGVRDLSFYFDLPNIEKKNEMLHLLPYGRWEHEGLPLSIRPGANIYAPTENGRNGLPLAAYDPANLSDQSIINSYDYRFVTVTDEIVNRKNSYRTVPDELSELFPQAGDDERLKPLLWIRVSLPPGFEDYMLDDFFISINAFPVINRKQYSKYQKRTATVSYIPLETGENEYFLSVAGVADSNGKRYMHLPFKDSERKANFGTYILKRGGAERFDSRNAKEYLSNLIDLMREESIAFSMMSRKFLDTFVKRIETELASAEQKLSEIRINRDVSSYLIIDSDDDAGDTIHLDYWVTNCEAANGIKSGHPLSPSSDVDVDKNTVVTLTQSCGGGRRNNNPLDTYKYILTCRDRIYTDGDIENFCFAMFGDAIASVSVKKGVRVGSRPKEGLLRSIDVHVTLKERLELTSSGRREMEDRMLSLLKSKSPEIYNYRIFILENINKL